MDGFGEVEHGIFHVVFFFQLRQMRFADVNMAGRAGAGPAAIRINTGDHILNGGFHDGGSVFGFNFAAFTGMVDKDDFRHGELSFELCVEEISKRLHRDCKALDL